MALMAVALLYIANIVKERLYGVNLAAPVVLSELSPRGRDAPGRDLKGVPRYPGSRRIFYRESSEKASRVYSAAYRCDCDSTVASRFMKDGMVKLGWRLVAWDEVSGLMLFSRETSVDPVIAQVFYGPAHDGKCVVYVVVQNPSR